METITTTTRGLPKDRIHRTIIRSAGTFLGTLLIVSTVGWCGQQHNSRFSTQDQIKEDFGAVPCKNEARLSAVKALFEKMGAEPSQITVAKYANVENLIVRKPGATEEKIIVGAHYDKVSAGCGAVDNWSGIVVLAHLYRTFKQVPLNKTLIIVAFGKEEEGLLGSKAMMWGIKKEETSQYCAMINIDSLGMGIPQVADNMSTQTLEDLASGLAKKMNMPFRHASILDAGADSQPFVAKGIPALTLHGLTDDWRSVLHTTDDKPSRVDPASVYLGYGLVLALVASIDNGACGAYR
jgi:hypothetical protein